VSLLGGAAPVRKPREKVSYLRGWEHRREADEAVEVNLRPDEIALWRKIKARFKGSPHERFEKFRHYVHDHPEALRAHVALVGETQAAALVRARESAAAVKVPCRTPYRFRTKAACNPETPHKRQPKWMRSSLLRAGRSVEVLCGPPDRWRVKEFCHPRERRWVPPPPEEPVHAFEGLIG
jgi:hypothetical protein